LLALAPLSAQVARPVPATLQTGQAHVSLATLATLSRGFDRDLRMFAVTDPIDVLGNTRGIYLDGYGAVFTTELSPVFTPGLSPFQPNISEQDKAKVRQRKLARLPVVERLMNSMLQSAAKELTGVPEDQQVVVMVNFVYLPYEDTTGLPGQMVAKATRRAILSGAQIEAKVTDQ
jgi:hypothetical protein